MKRTIEALQDKIKLITKNNSKNDEIIKDYKYMEER
jgi:hypothetical protein